MAKVVKWKAPNHSQWHYGIVIDEATDGTLDGPYVEVEYTHSIPASRLPAGRKIRLYGVHQVQSV